METGEGLPDELRDMGYLDEEFEYVTGDDAGAQAKLDAFGPSSRWILLARHFLHRSGPDSRVVIVAPKNHEETG